MVEIVTCSGEKINASRRPTLGDLRNADLTEAERALFAPALKNCAEMRQSIRDYQAANPHGPGGFEPWCPQAESRIRASTPLAPLLAQKQWVIWRWESNGGKLTKIPFKARDPESPASSTNKRTWASFDAASSSAHMAAGIGFMLYEGPFAAFDLDQCRNPQTGAISPWAIRLLQQAHSYAEVTPSGTGLRIIGLCAKDEKCGRKFNDLEDGGSLETYRHTGRYITVTGAALEGYNVEFANIDELMDRTVERLDKEKLEKQFSQSPTRDPSTNAEKEPAFRKFDFNKLSKDLQDRIKDGPLERDPSRSEAYFAVACGLVRDRMKDEDIIDVLLNPAYKISEAFLERRGMRAQTEMARTQVAKARKAVEKAQAQETKYSPRTDGFAQTDKGAISACSSNIRLAISRLKIEFRYNQFSYQTEMEGLGPDFDGELTDDGAVRLRFRIEDEFHFLSKMDEFNRVINDLAQTNRYHPVREYLDGLTWDGVPRIDKWLIDYAGAQDTPLNRATGSIFLISAVRRVRQPGVKHDEMIVLQGEEGMVKSSACRVMAVRDEWFSDSLTIGSSVKEVIEQSVGHWIIEFGELATLGKREDDTVKSFLSRQEDKARPAYGHRRVTAKRQFVCIGTINEGQFLKPGKNRRWWVVPIKVFDLIALRADRDQLWAEAAFREAQGESIALRKELWGDAEEAQKKHQEPNPIAEELTRRFGQKDGGVNGWILASDLWDVLNIPLGVERDRQAKRVGQVMQRDLKFERIQIKSKTDKHLGGVNGSRVGCWYYERGDSDDVPGAQLTKANLEAKAREEQTKASAPGQMGPDSVPF